MTSIKKNFIWNIILRVSVIVFPLITYPYISRVIGVEGVGKVSFAKSIIAYFSIIAQLGIQTYGIRETAKSANDKDLLSRTSQEILIINIVTTIVAYLTFFIAIFFIPRLSEERTLLIVASLEMAFTTIGMVWLFAGLEKYSYITKRSIVIKILSLLLMFSLVHERDDYIMYCGILVIATAGSNILNLIYSRKLISYQKYNSYDFRKHIKPIFVFFMMSIATTVYTSLDTVMLGFMAGDVQVGLYTSATKIRTVLLGMVNALSTVLLPRASSYVSEGKIEDFRSISKKAFHFIVIVASSAWVYFTLFAKESILLLSGEEFAGAIIPMYMIMPTVLICGISNLTAIQMLVSLGKEKAVLYTQIIGAIIDFILNLILIPIYGATAAAASTMIAELVIVFLQIWILNKEGFKFTKEINFAQVLISLFIAAIGTVWMKNYIESTVLLVLVSAVSFFSVYVGSLFVFRDYVIIDVLSTSFSFIKRECKHK